MDDFKKLLYINEIDTTTDSNRLIAILDTILKDGVTPDQYRFFVRFIEEARINLEGSGLSYCSLRLSSIHLIFREKGLYGRV